MAGRKAIESSIVEFAVDESTKKKALTHLQHWVLRGRVSPHIVFISNYCLVLILIRDI